MFFDFTSFFNFTTFLVCHFFINILLLCFCTTSFSEIYFLLCFSTKWTLVSCSLSHSDRWMYYTKSSHRRCSVRKSLRPATLLKKRSDTGVFLWILGNFLEHLFDRAPPGDLFRYMAKVTHVVDASRETENSVEVVLKNLLNSFSKYLAAFPQLYKNKASITRADSRIMF